MIHTAYDLTNKMEQHPSTVMDSNIFTTTKLIEAMKEHKTKRLIFLSSYAVYEKSTETNEEAICRPVNIK